MKPPCRGPADLPTAERAACVPLDESRGGSFENAGAVGSAGVHRATCLLTIRPLPSGRGPGAGSAQRAVSRREAGSFARSGWGHFQAHVLTRSCPPPPRLCELGGHVTQMEQLQDGAGTKRRHTVQETRACCVLLRSRGALRAEKRARTTREIPEKSLQNLHGTSMAHKNCDDSKKGEQRGGLPWLMPHRVGGRSLETA